MKYQEAVDYLNAHISLGGKPGLERMTELVEFMGNPEQGFPIVHVAGTNGKTSTARIATMILAAHGLSTGTHTSPHLQRVEERLAVNGRIATEEEFALAVSDVAAFADLREQRGGVPNTYFELTAAAAFAFFADQAVNAAVVEVGLGGRLDATNVVDADVCVITSIGLDHTAMLGSDLATIAGEKVAIAGPGSILVSGDLAQPALEVVAARARELGIHHRRFGHDFAVEDAKRGVGGWLTTIRGAETDYEDVFLPVHGRHQVTNLATAIAASEALAGDALDIEAVREGTAAVTLPGRMEQVASDPLVMVDGAHNADGFTALARALAEEFPTTRWQLVVGAMADKDLGAMIHEVSPHLAGIVATTVESERAVPAEELARQLVGSVEVPVLSAETTEEALDMARAEAGPDGAVLVAGSLYLAGGARDLTLG